MKNEFILPFFPELTEESSKGSSSLLTPSKLFIYLLTHFRRESLRFLPSFLSYTTGNLAKRNGGEKRDSSFLWGEWRDVVKGVYAMDEEKDEENISNISENRGKVPEEGCGSPFVINDRPLLSSSSKKSIPLSSPPFPPNCPSRDENFQTSKLVESREKEQQFSVV